MSYRNKIQVDTVGPSLFLGGPTGATGAPDFRSIDGADLPLSTIPPLMAGVATSGVSTNIAREDHVHPSDLLNPRAFISTPYVYEEFYNVPSDIFPTTINGAGASVVMNPGTMQRPGQVSLTSGTNSAGRAAIATNQSLLIFGGGGGADFEAAVYYPVISVATNRFNTYLGFIDTLTGDQTDGVYFAYEEAVSPNWQICTASNSTRTKTITSVPVTAATWITVRVVVNFLGTLATYYINGTQVGTISTNIPTTTGQECGAGVALAKIAGGSSRNILLDYIYMQLNNPNL